MTLWVRFDHPGGSGFGVLDGDRIALHAGDMFDAPAPTGEVLARDQVRLAVPVRPRNFIGLWNNYHALAARLGTEIPTEPLFFLKSTGSLLAPEAVIRPPASYGGKIAYEGELGVVIGRRCSAVSESEAQAAIFGYTCINDVTALDLLNADPSFPQWARAKGCDSFGPCGPAIATGLDWSALRVRTLLNGRERQKYPASDMILPPARIISLISREMTLEPGDLIACGTSLGVLPMRPGMTVEIAIDGIGVLRNEVGEAISAAAGTLPAADPF
jgi:2-keto-4-pentenoate hydratase/2-oxohepta-3-ene-1,7-dioic acid hydratase in catechol pathway